MKGECYAIHSKGIGVLVVLLAGETEYSSVAAEFETQRERFRFLKLRDQWTETVPTATTFGGHVVEYRLQDGEGSDPSIRTRGRNCGRPTYILIGRVKRRGRTAFPKRNCGSSRSTAGDDSLNSAYVEDIRTSDVRAAPFVSENSRTPVVLSGSHTVEDFWQ